VDLAASSSAQVTFDYHEKQNSSTSERKLVSGEELDSMELEICLVVKVHISLVQITNDSEEFT
jgi:hypothetical protein